MSQETFRIPVSDITRGMVLAKDVVSNDKMVLALKDAILDNVSIRKLRAFGIEHVTIRPAVPRKLIKAKVIPNVVEKVEFISFENVYTQSTDEYRSLVQEISSGNQVDISELYRLTDGIMKSLKIKGDAFTFINYISQAEGHIFPHCVNVSILCNIFAHWLKLNPKAVMELSVAGLLHDIGMIQIDGKIINKPGPLTKPELKKIHSHPTGGYQMILNQNLPNTVKAAVLLHHERLDSSGYPHSFDSERITPYSKILSICDTYDAMTSDRPYRPKKAPFKVIRELEAGMYGVLDTRYLLIFLQNIAYNYQGAWVQLSDGRPAEIMFIHKLNISKPIVRTSEEEIIDLASRPDLEIDSLI
jgi:putative nucleotidyltransferase with HDIG domain